MTDTNDRQLLEEFIDWLEHQGVWQLDAEGDHIFNDQEVADFIAQFLFQRKEHHP